MEQIWAAYRTDQHNAVGGRVFLGFCGWHTNADSAKREAIARMATGRVKEAPEAVVMVNRT